MRRKIRDLRAGDGVDLRTFPPNYGFDEITWSVAEFQSAEVIGAEDVGTADGYPFTIESADCWVLHTSEGSFGIDPNWEVEVTTS
jgi:hypothetical protein